MNFILVVNLKVTMNFPHEVPLLATHPIIPRYREVERGAKMARMSQFPFIDTVLQSAESRSVAQSADLFQLFRGDVVVFLEMFRQETVYLDVADVHRTM